MSAQVKRTPRAPWDPKHAAELLEPDGGPHGELSPLPLAAAIRAEHAKFGDVLMLPGSTEIHQGGTSGLKTLTWWRHAVAHLPNAEVKMRRSNMQAATIHKFTHHLETSHAQ